MATLTVQPQTLAAGIQLQVGTEAHQIQLIAQNAPEGEIHVSVRDHEGHDPVPTQTYTVSGPHGVSFKGITDANGELLHRGPVPMDLYTLTICKMDFPIDARGPKDSACVIRVPGFGHEAPPPQQVNSFQPRPANAMGGRAFLEQTKKLPIRAKPGEPSREAAIFDQIVQGNLPSFCREWATVTLHWKEHQAEVRVLPDFVSIGSDSDYVRIPMGANLAQKVADIIGASLPTQVLVDEIYLHAQVRLQGHPQPPGPQMMTNAYIRKHEDTIAGREPCGVHDGHCVLSGIASASNLISGHKKEVIISQELAAKPDRLSFWGFYLSYNPTADTIKLGDKNTPVQQWSGGFHEADYCDYSHGIRLVHPVVHVDGVDKHIADVLADKDLAGLFTHGTGPIPTRYGDGGHHDLPPPGPQPEPTQQHDAPRPKGTLTAAAQAAFAPATANMEGRVHWMYTDNRHLVTTGMGNLINSVGSARELPWKHGATGPVASAGEVEAAWHAVNDWPNPDKLSGAVAAFGKLTDLRLSNGDIDALVAQKLDGFWKTLLAHFTEADQWPADGQLALLFMSWANGPAFGPKWPHFSAAVKKSPPDFAGAIDQAHWSNENHDRKAAISHLFQNAADVLASGVSKDALYWPNDATGAAKYASDTAAKGVAASGAPGGVHQPPPATEAPAAAPDPDKPKDELETFFNFHGNVGESNALRDHTYVAYKVQGKPDAWLIKGRLMIDVDGAPNCYHPNDHKVNTKYLDIDLETWDGALDWKANGGHPGNWFGVVTDTGQSSGNPIVQGPNDPCPGFYVSSTSLADHSKGQHDPLRYVDARKIPYLAYPYQVWTEGKNGKRFERVSAGATGGLGDLLTVVNPKADEAHRYAHAIIADMGGRDDPHFGEGSPALGQKIHAAGVVNADLLYIVYPHSGAGQGTIPSADEIHQKGEQLFAKWGGLDEVNRVLPLMK